MNEDVRTILMILLSFVSAILVELAYWVVRARTVDEPANTPRALGIAAAGVVGGVLYFGLSADEVAVRVLVAAVGVLAHTYSRARTHLPETLAGLGAYLAGKRSPVVVDPRATDPRRVHREQRFVVIGAVITVVAPIISAILYPEMRTYALLWAAVVAIPAAFLLWRWLAASRERS